MAMMRGKTTTSGRNAMKRVLRLQDRRHACCKRIRNWMSAAGGKIGGYLMVMPKCGHACCKGIRNWMSVAGGKNGGHPMLMQNMGLHVQNKGHGKPAKCREGAEKLHACFLREQKDHGDDDGENDDIWKKCNDEGSEAAGV